VEDIKAYIETGILELYVLEQLSAQEKKEVQDMAAIHPEIKEEITAIEIALEKYALLNASYPTHDLTPKIISAIGVDEFSSPSPLLAETSASAKVVPLNTSAYDSKIKTLRFALVACLALLVVSIIALLSAHQKLNSAQSQIAALSTQNSKFAATVGFVQESNKELQRIADIAGDKSWVVVNLAGTPKLPSAKLRVFWNKTSKDVLLDKKKMALPANDQQHQYQLWALVNGKPVDLGVFDSDKDSLRIIQNMKNIPAAQAFAVTIEKRGGSVNPTMEQLVLLGNVNI
jgi:anti-sigma-K factor RskA